MIKTMFKGRLPKAMYLWDSKHLKLTQIFIFSADFLFVWWEPFDSPTKNNYDSFLFDPAVIPNYLPLHPPGNPTWKRKTSPPRSFLSTSPPLLRLWLIWILRFVVEVEITAFQLDPPRAQLKVRFFLVRKTEAHPGEFFRTFWGWKKIGLPEKNHWISKSGWFLCGGGGYFCINI